MAIQLPVRGYTIEEMRQISGAVEILERIFPDHDIVFEKRLEVAKTPTHLYHTSDSIRDRVIQAVASHGPCTIDDLHSQTGLDKKKIRGVLNAPDLKRNFSRKLLNDGRNEYQWVNT